MLCVLHEDRGCLSMTVLDNLSKLKIKFFRKNGWNGIFFVSYSMFLFNLYVVCLWVAGFIVVEAFKTN